MLYLVEKNYLGVETCFGNSFDVYEILLSDGTFLYSYTNLVTGEIFEVDLR